jgi:hypothetical protein
LFEVWVDNLHFEKVVSFTSSLSKNSESVMQRIGMKYVANFDHPKIEKESLLCSHVLSFPRLIKASLMSRTNKIAVSCALENMLSPERLSKKRN